MTEKDKYQIQAVEQAARLSLGNRWVTGSVISEINGRPFTGKIDIIQHHSVLFITAAEEPYEKFDGFTPPDVELTMETYVKVSSLPENVQRLVRSFIRQ